MIAAVALQLLTAGITFIVRLTSKEDHKDLIESDHNHHSEQGSMRALKYFIKYLDPITGAFHMFFSAPKLRSAQGDLKTRFPIPAITSVFMVVLFSIPIFKRSAMIVLQGSPETLISGDDISKEIQANFKDQVASGNFIFLPELFEVKS